jgi:hypothetical protein
MEDSEQAFQEARAAWRAALRDHVLAPPDAGFSARLANLAATASQRASACEAAYKDGFEWPAARAGAKPPYGLQPATGRRGPEHLWQRFDETVAELDRVSEGRSIRGEACGATQTGIGASGSPPSSRQGSTRCHTNSVTPGSRTCARAVSIPPTWRMSLATASRPPRRATRTRCAGRLSRSEPWSADATHQRRR